MHTNQRLQSPSASPIARTRPRADTARRVSSVMYAVALSVALLIGCSDPDNGASTDTSGGSDSTSGADGTSDATSTDTSGTSDPDADDSADSVTTTCEVAFGAVTPGAFTLGTYPNAIDALAGFLYVVNSGDNTVQRVNIDTAASEPSFVDLGENQNPYDFTIFGDRIYITNLIANSVAVADLSTGQVISNTAFPELISPQDIIATDNYLIIANTEFVFGSGATEFGSVIVLSRDDTPTFINRIPTTQPNPQFVFVHGDSAYAVNSGLIEYDDNFVSSPVGDAGVDIIPLNALSNISSAPQNISLGAAQGFVGNPGAPAVIGDALFLGSGTAPILFQIDLTTQQVVRGVSNPIEVRPVGPENALMIPFKGPQNKLYVSDFNMDQLHVFDPHTLGACAPPLTVGESAELLEGPLAITWSGTSGFILNSIASTITRVEVP
jgi:hypothetical protein